MTSRVHFLNVKQGDSIIIEHGPSTRVTMIDVSCGNLNTAISNIIASLDKTASPAGNFNMCSKPTNPIDYLTENNISNIWRFILTHPDMDHMDGIKSLFNRKNITHFWDCGVRREKPDFGEGGPYLEEDWDFYDSLVKNEVNGTNTITPRAGENAIYWNRDSESGGHGDYLDILAPDETLIANANDEDDTNDSSYVIVYRSAGGNIIFAGDSHNKTWDYILDNHRALIEDAAVLFAPHHGRDSDRKWDFLDVIKPRVTFLGCAPSAHLAYDKYGKYGSHFTNNQCGNIQLEPSNRGVNVIIENEIFARKYNSSTSRQNGYWTLGIF